MKKWQQEQLFYPMMIKIVSLINRFEFFYKKLYFSFLDFLSWI